MYQPEVVTVACYKVTIRKETVMTSRLILGKKCEFLSLLYSYKTRGVAATQVVRELRALDLLFGCPQFTSPALTASRICCR